MRGDAETRLANFPNSLGLLLIGEQAHLGRAGTTAQRFHQAASFDSALADVWPPNSDEQPASALR